MSSLNEKLQAALDSRRRRNILRRLPESSSDSETSLVDFVTNDYLSLTSSETLRTHLLSELNKSPAILGSGGSRLLVNPTSHEELEERLRTFFRAPSALLFNSGFDANAALFSSVPQVGDVAVYDEFIHASVHDGLRASRLVQSGRNTDNGGFKNLLSFSHNSASALRKVLEDTLEKHARREELRAGTSSVFVAVEALYSMDGTLAPLPEIVSLLGELFPRGNAHLIVDEAHATGLYGPSGRGLVAHYGLEDKVFIRLHTFGKALASSGAVILTSPLVKEYLLNYARSLIYTTALSCSNIVAINCSFDMLQNGVADELSNYLQVLIRYTLNNLKRRIEPFPPKLVSLPPHLLDLSDSSLLSPIIPILTSAPRPLSAHLRELGLNARPITWPTVPKGKDRVRVCLHAGNTQNDIDRLIEGVESWAKKEFTDGKSGYNSLPQPEAKL